MIITVAGSKSSGGLKKRKKSSIIFSGGGSTDEYLQVASEYNAAESSTLAECRSPYQIVAAACTTGQPETSASPSLLKKQRIATNTPSVAQHKNLLNSDDTPTSHQEAVFH